MSLLIALILLFSLSLYVEFTQDEVTYTSAYVPINYLRKSDICSILSIALPLKNDSNFKIRVDTHHSRRTMLYFLLAIKSKSNNTRVLHFIDECYPNLNWSIVENNYHHLKNV
ncbi:unnamed protein product, partial [Adineta steineri]